MGAKSAPGRLIAVEAARGRDAERGAAHVRTALRRKRRNMRPAISHWDASGTFYELRFAGKKALTLAPRTLLLLYASDLAFRMRWEIQPALANGQTVIAAPYLDTAIAFGEAAGLPRKWLEEILRFAPRADVCLHVKDSKHGGKWARRAMDGFPEFAAAALVAGKHTGRSSPRCEQAIASLQRLKKTRACGDLAKRTLGSLVKTLRRDRRSAPSRDR
jgi:hypothetical protein